MSFWKRHKSKPKQIISADYQVLNFETARNENLTGWSDSEVAARQDVAYRELLKELHAGNPRQDLQVAAKALQATGIDSSVLEVGCGSGYYYEILSFLLKREVSYLGIDLSSAMTRLAKEKYPARTFLTADAVCLPFLDRSFDVVLNGGALMHILNYAQAISESSRVARSFCIFHTVPVLQKRPTTVLKKSAYGGPVLEVIFNEAELLNLFTHNYLKIRSFMESVSYNLESTLHEKTITKTYLCEVLPR